MEDNENLTDNEGSTDGEDFLAAERDIRKRLGDRELDFDSLHAISNIYRATVVTTFTLQPITNGSRVLPLNSTQVTLVFKKPSTASIPLSLPWPDCFTPPKGAL